VQRTRIGSERRRVERGERVVQHRRERPQHVDLVVRMLVNQCFGERQAVRVQRQIDRPDVFRIRRGQMTLAVVTDGNDLLE
jgi:hypothetical protein